MAKYRHKTFEMFDFVEEATSALSSKSARRDAEPGSPESWQFQHLVAAQREKVIHVRFKKKDHLDSGFTNELRSDFAHLADSIVNDSRVLLDFAGLNEFGAGCIDELKRFNGKLQSKGSQLVLCQLEPAVQASFFPHRIGNDRTTSITP